MKKYIVFSFDDGLCDFKANVLPILEKYNFKATINVVSGYADKSIKTNYPYLEVDDVVKLYNLGFEIANHTNSHIKHGSFDELQLCNDKINNWCGNDKVLGIAMPKYAKPCESAQNYIKEKRPPYLTYEVQKVLTIENIFVRAYWKILSLIKHDEKTKLIYSIQRKTYKKGKCHMFRRIEVGHDMNILYLYEALKSIRDGWCITLCFHSVVEDVESSAYPKGALTIKQFAFLCKTIYGDRDFQVLTQINACSKGFKK